MPWITSKVVLAGWDYSAELGGKLKMVGMMMLGLIERGEFEIKPRSLTH
jgi:hypothetical protein